jgi:putative flavoprotein involved in K+ transport
VVAPAGNRHSVIVIGGGQTGLAAGYHLAKRGIDFVILEASRRVGDVWRGRYASLRLYSPARYDRLPGLPFPLPGHAFPTGQQMADYLETYARHHGLPVETGVRALDVRASDDDGRSGGYTVSAEGGSYEADQVIVATGAFQRPHVPDFAADLDPAIRQIHSADYRSPDQLAEGPVLVVGLSHSGADIAHEIARHGHRTFVSGKAHGQLPFSVDSRRARVFWPLLRFLASNVLTLDTPIGRKMAPMVRQGGGPLLRHRRGDLEAAGVTLHEARTVGADDARQPKLADGTSLKVANVVWCTGFRPDYSWIHLPILNEHGWPDQKRGVLDATPGLYVLGMPFLHGFSSMLVLGAGRDAAHVVDRVTARADAAGRPATVRAGSMA